jgi:hypothetical protein
MGHLKAMFARKSKLLYTASTLVMTLTAIFGLIGNASAFTPSYNASNLIDNPTLVNNGTMSAPVIQAFLSSVGSGLAGYSDVEACDTTIAPYYTHCGQTVSAAQIIYDASQAYDINPRAILATLQKEQSLVTDPTPSSSQINCAMGYNSCSNYVGFFTQVDNGTWALAYNYQGALGTAHWLSWYPGANYPCRNATSLYSAGLYPGNTVTFANPGGVAQTIVLANAASASLYCYTPYVGPYSATGYSGSYNFVYYYQLWFGSTQASVPFAWQYVGQSAYSDAGMTTPFTAVPTAAPGGLLYLQIQARNVGFVTWSQSSMHIGTDSPEDRTSPFYDSSTWLAPTRPGGMTTSSVAPGQVATFDLTLQAPAQPGVYQEYYNLVDDGVTWLDDPGLYFTINVNNPSSPNNSNDTTLTAGQTLTEGQYLLSPDSQTVLTVQNNGDLASYSDGQISWDTGTGGSTNHLVMQTDGNLVLYNQSGVAQWDSGTSGNPGAHLVLQTDGNIVLYSAANAALWATYTGSNPNHLDYVNTTLPTGRLYPGQSINTADGNYHLIMQTDGNLVLYSPSRALWETGTNGDSVAYLDMQSDGNMVLYGTNGPLWYSNTAGFGALHLEVQQDGNLVLYNPGNAAVWDTGT